MDITKLNDSDLRYLEGFVAKCAELGVDPEAMLVQYEAAQKLAACKGKAKKAVKKPVKKASANDVVGKALSFTPGVGGYLEGAVGDPLPGRSIGGTMGARGQGGLTLGVIGALIAAALSKGRGAALVGGAAGTAAGSSLGGVLGARNVATQDQIRQLLQQQQAPAPQAPAPMPQGKVAAATKKAEDTLAVIMKLAGPCGGGKRPITKKPGCKGKGLFGGKMAPAFGKKAGAIGDGAQTGAAGGAVLGGVLGAGEAAGGVRNAMKLHKGVGTPMAGKAKLMTALLALLTAGTGVAGGAALGAGQGAIGGAILGKKAQMQMQAPAPKPFDPQNPMGGAGKQISAAGAELIKFIKSRRQAQVAPKVAQAQEDPKDKKGKGGTVRKALVGAGKGAVGGAIGGGLAAGATHAVDTYRNHQAFHRVADKINKYMPGANAQVSFDKKQGLKALLGSMGRGAGYGAGVGAGVGAIS